LRVRSDCKLPQISLIDRDPELHLFEKYKTFKETKARKIKANAVVIEETARIRLQFCQSLATKLLSLVLHSSHSVVRLLLHICPFVKDANIFSAVVVGGIAIGKLDVHGDHNRVDIHLFIKNKVSIEDLNLLLKYVFISFRRLCLVTIA
jgi:hypothetical protein